MSKSKYHTFTAHGNIPHKPLWFNGLRFLAPVLSDPRLPEPKKYSHGVRFPMYYNEELLFALPGGAAITGRSNLILIYQGNHVWKSTKKILPFKTILSL